MIENWHGRKSSTIPPYINYMVEFLIVAFAIGCFLGAAFMLIWLAKQAKTVPIGQQSRKRPSVVFKNPNSSTLIAPPRAKPSPPSPPKPVTPPSPQPLRFPSRANYNRLVSMLHGDGNAAERLVGKVRQQNPERSEDWCWEKVISDLERDRRV